MFDNDHNKIFEEEYPIFCEDNPCIDIILSQAHTYFKEFERLLSFFEGDCDEKITELRDIFWKPHLDEVISSGRDNAKNKNAYDKIIQDRSTIDDDIVAKFKNRIDFDVEDSFIINLESNYCLVQVVYHFFLENPEQVIIDRYDKYSFFGTLKHLTRSAIELGTLKEYFYTKANLHYGIDVEISFHQKGGLARKKKYEAMKQEALEKFRNGNFHSYAECARAIHNDLDIKDPNTIAKWLSSEFKK